MNLLRAFLYTASRSRMALWTFALVVLTIGAAIGYHLAQARPVRNDLFGERVLARANLLPLDEDEERQLLLIADRAPARKTPPELLAALDEELAKGKVSFRALVAAIPVISIHVDAKGDAAARDIFRKHFPPAEADLAADMLAAWHGRDPKALARIVASARATPPPPLVQHVLGRIAYHAQDYAGAYTYFRADADPATVGESRFWSTRALGEDKNFDELARLERLPEYARYFDSHLRLKVAVGRKDWPAILRTVPVTQLESYREPVFILAVLTGLTWGFFLCVLGDIHRPLSTRALLCGLALLAGMASTTPTLYLVILTEQILNLGPGDNLVHQFAFFTGGVAVREEVCKLLLFAPFLPILYRRDDELEVLIVASFVGLGFAMEENGGYLMQAAVAAPGRFLSANFFHIALTGMNGLALYRVCTHGWRGLNQFLFLFPVAVLAHGGYDTLLSSGSVPEGGYWAIGVYVLFAQYYLRTAHSLRPAGARHTFSLTGALVFGISTVAAVTLAYQMATLGAFAGGNLMLTELLGSAILLFLFFREFNEALTD
jgi:RsiW-degrading membrane proteinase PrsW (M82 family)